MRALLIFLLPLSLFAQDPCAVFYDEPSAQVSMLSSEDDGGHYRLRCVVHIFYGDSFPGSNLDDEITLAAIEAFNSDLEGTGMSVSLQEIEHHDIAESMFGDIISSGSVCFPIQGSGGINLMSMFAGEYAWDTSQYLNIYCIPFSCYPNYGFSFVHYVPTNLADGIWINYHAFGIFGEHLDYARDLNRTMTHEFGHYAGLYHVFQGVDYCGELVDDCQLEQDYVCDTAPTKVNWSCSEPTCPPAWNSLRPWAAYQHNNHMDYYVDSCRTTFTSGQIARMREIVRVFRPNVYDLLTCDSDVTGDNIVGTEDLMCILSCYEGDCCDITGDGYTGTLDLIQILSEYGNNCNVQDY